MDGKRRDLAPLRAMRAAIAHRGPDDEGEIERDGGGLGFRRLSILDLQNGHQPMLSENGEAAIVFNGEIYNHPQLKTELEALGEKYKTRTDTETILRLYLREGPDCVKKLRGMFAFAIWDFKKRRLVIARDHIGIKPLYYSFRDGCLYFSSELRSLLKAGLPEDFDPEGLRDYLEYNFVRAPKTIIAGITKLPAAHMLVINLDDGRMPEPQRYFSLSISDGADQPRDEKEAIEKLDSLLNESVRAHLLSDVPVGAFLSGGVDSSLVTALMCRHHNGKVKTFSIGFSGGRAGLDESKWAQIAAKYLGTEHNELVLPCDVLGKIPALMCALDEPLGDSAILPTYLLSQYAAKQVKVALSGEGADELFAGYNRYKAAYASYLAQRGGKTVSSAARRLFAALAKDKFYRAAPYDTQEQWVEASRHTSREIALSFMSADFAAKAGENLLFWRPFMEDGEGFNSALLADFRTVMSDCLLMKVDKATMAASIESRVPLLTPELAQFAFNMEPGLKLRRFKSKWLLRKLAEKYLPHELVWRKKHGFWAPWEEWLQSGPAEVFDALSGSEMAACGGMDWKKFGESMRTLKNGGRTVDNGLMFRIAVLVLWRRSLSVRH